MSEQQPTPRTLPQNFFASFKNLADNKKRVKKEVTKVVEKQKVTSTINAGLTLETFKGIETHYESIKSVIDASHKDLKNLLFDSVITKLHATTDSLRISLNTGLEIEIIPLRSTFKGGMVDSKHGGKHYSPFAQFVRNNNIYIIYYNRKKLLKIEDVN